MLSLLLNTYVYLWSAGLLVTNESLSVVSVLTNFSIFQHSSARLERSYMIALYQKSTLLAHLPLSIFFFFFFFFSTSSSGEWHSTGQLVMVLYGGDTLGSHQSLSSPVKADESL